MSLAKYTPAPLIYAGIVALAFGAAAASVVMNTEAAQKQPQSDCAAILNGQKNADLMTRLACANPLGMNLYLR
ncbi:MAG TPA: hypothetical protein VGD95_00490 [Micavibrio sp.]